MNKTIWTDEKIIDLYNKEYIGQHKGCPFLSKKYGFYVYDQFKKLNLPLRNDKDKNKKYYCNSSFFKELNTEEKAYWFGFILGDGYISSSSKSSNKLGISLQDCDYEHLLKFNKAIQGNYPIKHYLTTNGYKINSPYCRIVIVDDNITNDLISHGCIKNKTNKIKPPENLDYKLRRHFIRGYLDANGCISISKGKSYSIKITGTNEILNWIMNHLIEEKILSHSYHFYKRKEDQIVSNFEFGGNYLSLKFLNYIYEDATVWLDRKHDRYLSLKKKIENRRDERMA